MTPKKNPKPALASDRGYIDQIPLSPAKAGSEMNVEPRRYGEMVIVGALLLATPWNVTVTGRSPVGKPFGNTTTM